MRFPAFLLLLAALHAAPKAVLPQPEFAFGKVLPGTILEHDFVLRNEGTEPLRITGVQLTPPLRLARTPAVIAPGSETALRVQLPADAIEGEFEGELRVRLNDPARPEAVIKVSAELRPAVEILPRPAVFLAAERGHAAEQSVEIVNHETEPMRIVAIDPAPPRVAVRLETIEEGRRYRLDVSMQGSGPAGRRTDFLVLHTTSVTRPLLKILAGTYLHERVYTFPDRLDFGAVPLSAVRKAGASAPGLVQTLMVYKAGADDFKVRCSAAAGITILRAEPGPRGDRYQITVGLSPEAAAGAIDAALQIETNDREFSVLRVPVTGRILPE